MAETAVHLVAKDITSITFKDATGTPLTYTIKPTEGTVTLRDGQYDYSIAEDIAGEPLSGGAPRQAGVRDRCAIVLNCKVFDVGDHATDVTLMDFIHNDGVFASTWVSTANTVETSVKCWNVEVLVADRTYAGPTTIKGGTYTFPDVLIEGTPSVEVSRGAFLVSGLELKSTTATKWTFTRTS